MAAFVHRFEHLLSVLSLKMNVLFAVFGYLMQHINNKCVKTSVICKNWPIICFDKNLC